MTRGSQDEERKRRDLVVFVLIPLLGAACLIVTAEIAVRPTPIWRVSADMLSRIDPDASPSAQELLIEPLRPEIMTPQPWDLLALLTPAGPGTVVPPVVFAPFPTGTATPQAVAAIATPLPTRRTPSPSPTPTATRAPGSPTPTMTPGLPSPTPTATPTSTPLPTSVPPTATPRPPTPTSQPPTPTPRPPTPTATPQPPTPTATPMPAITGITPNTAVNTAPVDVVISGQGFLPGCTASLGTIPLTVTGCTSTTIFAQVPADLPLGSFPAGYYDLTVTNGGYPLTLSMAYTATNPIPVITSVTPALGREATEVRVTIEGDNFRQIGTPGALEARLDGTALNLTYISPTLLTATVPATMPLGGYTLTIINPGPTAPSGDKPYAFTVYTYTTDITCTGGVNNCSNAAGEPDGQSADFNGSEVITFSFGSQGITDGPGYDLVFYEWPYGSGIRMDFVTIELSNDGNTWYTIFEWDGDNPGDVRGTNIDGYASDGESENEPISSVDLYPGGLPTNTGIAIDIGGVMSPPPPGSYPLVRFRYPSGGTDWGQVDALLRLH